MKYKDVKIGQLFKSTYSNGIYIKSKYESFYLGVKGCSLDPFLSTVLPETDVVLLNKRDVLDFFNAAIMETNFSEIKLGGHFIYDGVEYSKVSVNDGKREYLMGLGVIKSDWCHPNPETKVVEL